MLKHLAVAYYPEDWEESRWPADIELMKANGIGTVRILEFAWSRMERNDDEWTFDWVHRLMKLLEKSGVNVVLCTPSASPPPWLTLHHPECLQVSAGGQRASHGHRRHYCPTSSLYRRYCNRIAAKMQQELGGYKNVTAWHIDNELGFNRCWCSECELEFRRRMKAKYCTLENLNKAWGGVFWSVEYSDWDDVTLPHHPAPAPEVKLEFAQFYSDSIIGFMKEQYDALRKAGTTLPISTNMMGNFDQIDYWEMAGHIDFVGWDNYWFLFTLSANSFAHNLMRSLKSDRPYWTFENGVETYPGFNVLHGLSALAHGEELHTIFRWRTCPWAHEMDLPGLLDWAGKPKAKLDEMKELHALMLKLAKVKLPPIANRVAIVFSYQNYWATGMYYGDYWNEVNDYYQALFDLGLTCDCVPPSGDLSKYDLVLTPGLSLIGDSDLENFRSFVSKGGVLVSGRKTFAKLPTASYRMSDHPAIDVFGLRVVETQSNEDTVDINASIYKPPFQKRRFALVSNSGLPETRTNGWFEVLEPGTAKVLYYYKDGYYPGRPAAAINKFGMGRAIYIGSMLEREAMREIMRMALKTAGITNTIDVPHGVQFIRRGDVCFVSNYSLDELHVDLPSEGKVLAGAVPRGRKLTLPSMDFSVIWLKPAGSHAITEDLGDLTEAPETRAPKRRRNNAGPRAGGK